MYYYNKTDEIFHSASCICGYTYSERHSMTEADYTDGDNIGRCIQCEKRFMINNEMFPILPTSITKYYCLLREK